MKLQVGLVLFAVASHASAFAAGQFRTENALKTNLNGPTFTGTLTEGFHFNEKAPNSLVLDGKTLKPTRLESRKVEFTGLPPKWSAGRAALYVCDDAVTFCEPRMIELKGATSANKKAEKISSSRSKGKVNKHGFIEDDLNRALELARKQKQPVLIDFSARWCPGCIRLEGEIFDQPAFKKMTRGIVKLKIDVDRFENNVLSEKYKVKGIPTLLVINADQEEVDRLYDYQPLPTLEQFFKSVQENPASLRELTEKVKGKDPTIMRLLGVRLLGAGRYQESVELLSQVQPTPVELLNARVKAAAAKFSDDPKTKDDYVKVLREAIQAEPSSTRSIAWRQDLVARLDDKAEIAKVSREGVAVADVLLKDHTKIPEAVKGDLVGEFTGYEPLLIATNRAVLVESSQPPKDEELQAWQKAADIGRDLKIPASKTGPSMRYLITLFEAERFAEADALTRELLKREPGNPELQRRQLRALLGLKNYSEAIKVGEAAIKNSYGRNEYWVAESLAKAYIGANRKDEARALIDRYLGRADADWSNMKSSRQSLEQMKAAL